jgi:hypothetical protein
VRHDSGSTGLGAARVAATLHSRQDRRIEITIWCHYERSEAISVFPLTEIASLRSQ